MTPTITKRSGVCSCIILSAVEPTLLRDWRLMTFGKNPHMDMEGNYSEECRILHILADLGFYLDPETTFMDIPRQGPIKLMVRNVWSSSPNGAFQLILTNPRALVLVSSGLTRDVKAMKEIVRSQTILPNHVDYNPILLSDEDQVSLERLYGLSYIKLRSRKLLKPGPVNSTTLPQASRHNGEYRTIALYPSQSNDVRIGGTLINPKMLTFSIGPNRSMANFLPLFHTTQDHLESSTSFINTNRSRSVQSAVSRIDNTRRRCIECDTTYYAPALIANISIPQTFESSLLTTDSDSAKNDITCSDIAHSLTHIIDALVSDKRNNPIELLFGNGMSRPGCRFLWVPPLNITYTKMGAAALALGSICGQDPVVVSLFVMSSRLPVSVFDAIKEGLEDPNRILKQRQYLPSMTVATLLEDAANLCDRLSNDRSLLSGHIDHPAVEALATAVFEQNV